MLLRKYEIKLGFNYRGNFLEFSNRWYSNVFTFLEETFEISPVCNIETQQQQFVILSDFKKIGILKINNKSITFDIRILNRIQVEQLDGSTLSLGKYIINKKLYSIVFDDIKYMYFMGQCFQDASGISEIDSILEILLPKEELNIVTTEKGKVSEDKTRFDSNSMFNVIENIHSVDDYIFCDDLGNEWCDHITINIHEKTINFIHSKAKNVSLSASNMHDVVSQGIKNLGNMFFTKDDFIRAKRRKFQQMYNGSQIPRIRQGALADEDIETIDLCINDHKVHRQCILSCSFLSKSAIETEFDKIKNGEQVRGNIVQLFWILSSFIHACRGMHVVPVIYCKE